MVYKPKTGQERLEEFLAPLPIKQPTIVPPPPKPKTEPSEPSKPTGTKKISIEDYTKIYPTMTPSAYETVLKKQETKRQEAIKESRLMGTELSGTMKGIMQAPAGTQWKMPIEGQPGVHRIISKSEAISLIESQQAELGKYQKGLVDTGDITKEYAPPKGFDVVVSTPIGYQFKKSEEQIRKERYAPMKKEFAKFETVYEAGKKLFKKPQPVSRTVGIGMMGIGAVGEFGYGAVSSMEATIASVHSIVTGKPIYKPSMFDIAFEPEGAKIWGKHPLFTAGSVFGETLQAYGFSKAFSGASLVTKAGKTIFRVPGITSIATKGIKTGISKVPQVYSKFTRVFPEEKIIPTLARKTTEVTFRPMLGGAPVAKTVYQWGAKGFQKGIQLAETKPIVTTWVTKKGDITTKTIMKRTIYGGEKIKKVWLSPESYAEAQKSLAARLAQKPHLDIAFPKPDQPMSMIRYEKWRIEGIFHKRFVQPKTIFYTEYAKEPLATRIFPKKYMGFTFKSATEKMRITGIVDEPVFGGRGITYLKPLTKTGEITLDVGEIAGREGKAILGTSQITKRIGLVTPGTRYTKISAFESLFKKGFWSKPSIIKDISKEVSSSIAKGGFVPGGQTPMEAWTKQAAKASAKWKLEALKAKPFTFFKEAKEAVQPLITQIETKQLFKGTKPLFSGRLGLVQKLQSPILPIAPFSPAIPALITYPIFKTELISLPKRKLKPEITTISRQKKDMIVGLVQFPVSMTGQITGQAQVPALKVDLGRITITKPVTEQILAPAEIPPPVSLRPPPPHTIIPVTPKMGIPLLFPPSGIYGRGRLGWGRAFYAKKYKFRKRTVVDPFQSRIKIKPIVKI